MRRYFVEVEFSAQNESLIASVKEISEIDAPLICRNSDRICVRKSPNFILILKGLLSTEHSVVTKAVSSMKAFTSFLLISILLLTSEILH